MKKLLSIFLILILIVSLSACGNKTNTTPNNKKDNNPEKIEFSDTELNLSVGETKPLLIKTTPADIEDKIVWKSSDENVAKYFDGEVIGKNKGSCNIIATTPSGTEYTCKVNVNSKIIDSGSFGENATWTFYEDFTLVISGTGDMQEYYQAYQFSNPLNKGKSMPWSRYNSMIKNIEISEGITSISRYAFYNSNFNTISIPSSVVKIGYRAFFGARSCPVIVIPKTVKELGAGVFGGTSANVYYELTESDFNKITTTEIVDGFSIQWNASFEGNILFYSETPKEGCWRYVDNTPTKW